MARFRVILKPLHRGCNADRNLMEPGECDEGHGERVFDADLAKMMDDGTLAMGFKPGTHVYVVNGFGTNRHRKYRDKIANKTRNPEFWSLRKMPDGFEITQKFEKVLTANVDNVISVNGKPLFNIRDLSGGFNRLDLDENWSINKISDLLEE